MRFVVDGQLPDLLVTHLTAPGHDAIHVKALPNLERHLSAIGRAFEIADHVELSQAQLVIHPLPRH